MHMLFALWIACTGLVQVTSLDAPESHIRSKSLTSNTDSALLQPDYDVFSFPHSPSKSSDLVWYQKAGNITSTGRPYLAHVAVFQPAFFSFYPPTTSGCIDYMKTSVSSSTNYDCEYATNGGFFIMNAAENDQNLCVGNLVSDGHPWVLEGFDDVNFGITKEHRVVMGFIDETVYMDLNFSQLISGKGWLVRNGASYISQSSDINPTSNFAVEKAPRTSIGVFPNGSMVLYEVDGEEDIDAGPDLFEMAELLVDLGVISAVNMDGGGSSVSVHNGEVVSLPTCDDSSTICEREVQSIACVLRKR